MWQPVDTIAAALHTYPRGAHAQFYSPPEPVVPGANPGAAAYDHKRTSGDPAEKSGMVLDTITVHVVEPADWADASLGCGSYWKQAASQRMTRA